MVVGLVQTDYGCMLRLSGRLQWTDNRAVLLSHIKNNIPLKQIFCNALLLSEMKFIYNTYT